MIVKFIYALFLGLFCAFVVGAGIAAFYPKPDFPVYPVEIIDQNPEKLSDEEEALQEAYNLEVQEYEETYKNYNRNVALMVLVFAVLLLAISVSYTEKLGVISEGLMFGGIFTLLYSTIRGFDTNDDATRFLIMLVALGVAMGFGYWKFVLPTQKKTAKK